MPGSPSLIEHQSENQKPQRNRIDNPGCLGLILRVSSITHPHLHPLREINEFANYTTMPLMPGLLRRRGAPASDAELRRHSFYTADASSNPAVHHDGRASEQIPRRPSAAEFLSPEVALDRISSSRQSAESAGESLHRTVSPPIQEENQKHRRFSMLKFRHASDSQLSTRGRPLHLL